MDNLENRLKKIKSLTDDSRKPQKPSKYSYIDPELILILLEEGARVPEIGEIYGCCAQTISYHMKKIYTDYDARKYHKWRKREITTEKVVKLYKKLRSSTKIARLLHVGPHVVTDRLKAAGIKLRPLYREDILTQEVARIYATHKKTSKVAEILNINIPLVRKRLDAAGIELGLGYRHEPKRTDLPQKQVLRLYDGGESVASISRKYKANPATIRRIITYSGREIKEHVPCYREDINPERVAYWYKRLKRISRVAKRLNTCHSVIRDRMKKAGIETDESFRKERKRKDIPIKKVVRLHESGVSISEISRRYAAKRETIKRMLVKYEKRERT